MRRQASDDLAAGAVNEPPAGTVIKLTARTVAKIAAGSKTRSVTSATNPTDPVHGSDRTASTRCHDGRQEHNH